MTQSGSNIASPVTTKQKAASLLSIKEILTVFLFPSVRRWQARRHQPVPSGLPAVRVQTSPVGASHWLPPAPEEHHDSAQKQTQVWREMGRKEKKKNAEDLHWLNPSQSLFAPIRCILIGPHFCSLDAEAVIKLLALQRASKRHGHQVWSWGRHSPSALRALLSQPDAFCRLWQIWRRLTWWRCKATYVKKTRRWVKKKSRNKLAKWESTNPLR